MDRAAFDRTQATPGFTEEDRRLELQRDIARARARGSRWWLAAVVTAALFLGWWFRYEVTTSSGDTSRAYVLDRLTGRFFVIYPNGGIEPAVPGK